MSFNPKNIVDRFKDIDSFVTDYIHLTSKKNPNLFDKIKKLYYDKIKYAWLKKRFEKQIINDIAHALEYPNDFVNILDQYIGLISSFCPDNEDLLNEFIEKHFNRYGVSSPIKIHEITYRNGRFCRYKLSLHYLPKRYYESASYFPDNIFHCEIDGRLVVYDHIIDIQILNTDDINNKEALILYEKHIELNFDEIKMIKGTHVKPTLEEEFDEYRKIMTTILAPFVTVLDSISYMSFLKINKK